MPTHSHEHMFLSLLIEGGYREWVGGRRIDYGPLTAVFHPERLEHHDEILAPGTMFFVIEINPVLLAARERRHRALASICDLSGGPVVWAMLRLLDELRMGRRDDLELEEPAVEIVDVLLGAPAPAGARPRWLGRVEERLSDDFRAAVALSELAGLAGVHPVHLSRVFRRHIGCTMRTFVHRLRVLHACRSIAGGRSPLAAVAADSGFCDQSHMTHVFRLITGVTPTRYRRIVRQ
ncbi:MAG TPA: AraC family transcriptional regulator [Kofleriaceae bacterium]|nr:AraC family transcriptional regulator [Kofleriaceae bacterium]